MRTSEQINEIAAALSAFQGAAKHPKKNADNPFYKTKYADLGSYSDAAFPLLAKHGLAIVMGGECRDGNWILTGRLIHSSGQWIEAETAICSEKPTAQGHVAATTYARRCLFGALTGLVGEDDDDGNAASEPAKKSMEPESKSARKAKIVHFFATANLPAMLEQQLHDLGGRLDAALKDKVLSKKEYDQYNEALDKVLTEKQAAAAS